MDPTFNNVFYFSVTQADGSDTFTSHYFNISDAVTTTTSSAPTGATLTASSVSAPSVSSSITGIPASATPQSTLPATPASNKVVLSPGAIAGLVVGVVVGSLLFAGIAMWAWKTRRTRQTKMKAPQQQQPNAIHGQPYIYQGFDPHKKQAFHVHESAGAPIHELHETMERPVPELHGSGGQPRHEMGYL